MRVEAWAVTWNLRHGFANVVRFENLGALKTTKRRGFPFSIHASAPILDVLSQGSYGHKRARNKRIGPGGGTRRLHQISFVWGSWGRNRIDERLKGLALSR